jgi:multiple sugar transport system ATP-binding protein
MNLIKCQLSNGAVAVGNAKLTIPPNVGARSSARTLVGIRSNAIQLHDRPITGSMEASVALVEHLGTESSIAVVLDGASTTHTDGGSEEFIMITKPGYSELTIGQKVHMTFDTTQMVLFEAATGNRIR